MSEEGQKHGFQRLLGMSAFPPIATELLDHTKVVWRIDMWRARSTEALSPAFALGKRWSAICRSIRLAYR
jgi:hypothetical protein